jgi:hypothetical protein
MRYQERSVHVRFCYGIRLVRLRIFEILIYVTELIKGNGFLSCDGFVIEVQSFSCDVESVCLNVIRD